jgi:hypothetical protein
VLAAYDPRMFVGYDPRMLAGYGPRVPSAYGPLVPDAPSASRAPSASHGWPGRASALAGNDIDGPSMSL